MRDTRARQRTAAVRSRIGEARAARDVRDVGGAVAHCVGISLRRVAQRLAGRAPELGYGIGAPPNGPALHVIELSSASPCPEGWKQSMVEMSSAVNAVVEASRNL